MLLVCAAVLLLILVALRWRLSCVLLLLLRHSVGSRLLDYDVVLNIELVMEIKKWVVMDVNNIDANSRFIGRARLI